MFKQNLAFLRKIPVLLLLLMLGINMVATCPVKSLVFDLETVRSEKKSSPKPADRAGSVIGCSVDSAVAEASLPDIHKSGVQKAIPFLLFAVLLFFPAHVARVLKPPFADRNYRKTVSIPLFLRNSSWLL